MSSQTSSNIFVHSNSNRTTSGVQHSTVLEQLQSCLGTLQTNNYSSPPDNVADILRQSIVIETFQGSDTTHGQLLAETAKCVFSGGEFLTNQLKLVSDKTCVSFQLLEDLAVVIFGDLTVFSNQWQSSLLCVAEADPDRRVPEPET